MLTLELHRGDADREPEVILCFNSRGADALINAIQRLVQQGKDGRDHVATAAWAGAEPGDESLNLEATPLKHLQLVFRAEGAAATLGQRRL